MEHCLTSLVEQSLEADQDRSFITQALADEKKRKLEKDLQELIHLAATRIGVDHKMESQVNIDLKKDLQWILSKNTLSSYFNTNLLLRDIKSSMKAKYPQILENESDTSRKKIIFKLKDLTDQEKRNRTDDSLLNLSDLVEFASKGSIEISGWNEKDKTSLSK